MNIVDLRQKLIDSNVPPDAYSLSGGLPNEAYCIERNEDGGWSTYYSERGVRTDLKKFPTEDAACEHLYRMIVR